MIYKKVKVYSDGSHYIGILPSSKPINNNREFISTNIRDIEMKIEFDKVYSESSKKSNEDKKYEIIKKLSEKFDSENINEFVEQNIDKKQRNVLMRKIRLYRKANLNNWNYFVTFTYDSAKHTAESFQNKLLNCLRHLASRKGWKYIGVWEKSPEKERLHFHALVYIPEGSMVGEIVERKDYSTKTKRMQTTYQNTFFLKKFGRNDFEELEPFMLSRAIGYLTKYITKNNERIIYSRGLKMYIVSDIEEDDILCKYNDNDYKVLLFDDFKCINNGKYIGNVSPEVIEKMPKCN